MSYSFLQEVSCNYCTLKNAFTLCHQVIRLLVAPDQSYHCLMADAHAHQPSNPLPDFSSQLARDFAERVCLPQGATGISGSPGGQPLGKEFALAVGIETSEATHLDNPPDPLPTAR
jgi:hypothetical protein